MATPLPPGLSQSDKEPVLEPKSVASCVVAVRRPLDGGCAVLETA